MRKNAFRRSHKLLVLINMWFVNNIFYLVDAK